VDRYDPVKTRERLLFLKDNPTPKQVEFSGEFKSEKEKRFAQYFSDHIHPKLEWYHALEFRYVALMLLMDSGSQHDDKELDKWKEEFNKVQEDDNSFIVDTQWTEHLRVWANLADGLTGELPDLARRLNRKRQFDIFPEHMKAKMDEASKLMTEYKSAMNGAEYSKAPFKKFMTERLEVEVAFKDGKISFEEAYNRINKMYSEGGPAFIGYEIAQKSSDALNKMAVLRSELVKSKISPITKTPYKTWTQYALDNSGDGYSEQYRGIEKQRTFLIGLINTLRPVVRKIFEDQVKALGYQDQNYRINEQVLYRLFSPKSLAQLKGYFPAENVTNLWERAMLDSGFSPEVLSQITVDDDANRANKNTTMAYLMGWFGPYTEVETIDAQTLNSVREPIGSDKWKKGLVYILQSYQAGGINDTSTAFHEGGHALEKLLKFKMAPTDEAYGYVETPSMSMERFMSDAEFLFNNATPVNGEKPSRELIAELAQGHKKQEIIGLMHNATSALFDIDLWNYDYSKRGAQTFMERVEFLYKRNERLSGARKEIRSPVPMFYNKIYTDHFVSGQVRYIGYTYAELASMMMANFLYDEMEKTTGRRTWHKQPGLAKILAEKFYSQGWKTTFPENIEGITGRKYDPESIVAQAIQDVMGCEGALTSQK